jgi:predicted transcriptional regulator
MSADQLIAEFKALPPDQRQQVAEAIFLESEAWIPDSFRQGMEDIQKGRTVSLETALTQTPPRLEA